jgi:hypothetical protein
MVCDGCGLCWDTNDPEPPDCKPKRKPEKSEAVKARGTSFRERAAAAGRVRREYYALPAEHEQIKQFLAKIRHKTG